MTSLDYLPPTITTFDPDIIPYQGKVIRDIRAGFDYSKGVHEILLSGSVGSSKSTLMAHIILTHCIMNPGARFMIGRLSMPALKSTLFAKILEHIGSDLKEGKDFWVNQTSAQINFSNRSQIISRSWQDKRYFKVRSLELSGAAIEETTENTEDDFYYEIKMRVGRLPWVKENIILHATNPGAPSHWAYKYFIGPNSNGKKHPTRHVYYSVTTDNPFLPKHYVDQLKADLDPKMAQRMIYGRWIEINTEVIYHQYGDANRINRQYEINPQYPIHISYDFNIGHGKPMSCCLFQYTNDEIHIFDECVIDGMRTADTIDELNSRGLLVKGRRYIINGDATGKNRDTRNSKSDYDIIARELDALGIEYELDVPTKNPPIRTRHNTVNAYCRNEAGKHRLFVYPLAKTADEGLRLTALKEKGQYIEDDSKRYQHITTAIGYGLMASIAQANRQEQRTIQL